MSGNKQEAREIFDVNDEAEQMRLQRRFNQVHSEVSWKDGKKYMHESDLSDVKMKLNKQLNEQMKNR